MADEQSFPTAIIPVQPGSVDRRFDRLARTFGDPMAKLFLLQNARKREVRGLEIVEEPDLDMQFRAAAELMPYRYPKLKVSEIRGGAPGAGVNVQINIGGPAPAAPPVVDVTPVLEDPPA